MKWQPMKTAPKDGTQILLLDWVNGFYYIGAWDKTYKAWQVGAFYHETLEKDELPTHWMKLPRQPGAKP